MILLAKAAWLGCKYMKKIVIGICLMFLFFGCIDLGGDTGPVTGNGTTIVTPPVNDTAPPIVPNDTTIIIDPQENQTVEQNYTPPTPPPIKPPEGIQYTEAPDEKLAVYFIYVGDSIYKRHGDSILIRKGDLDILIDAGPAESGGKVLNFLQSRGIDDLDLVISTNADKEHYGGLSMVTNAYDVEELWWSGEAFGDQAYLSAVSGIKAKETKIVDRGFNMTLNGIELKVLNPIQKRFADVNNDAIVLRLQDRNFSMLLLSGVQFGSQNEMINNIKKDMQVNVMQAPYYGLGAGTSGIGNFLTTAKPEVMVISGGPNESPESGGDRSPFRRLLDQHDIEYYENYIGGTVRVTTDGSTYAVSYFSS